MNADPTQTPATPDTDALERLRDRTDELELIISSLTIFALFSMPGWLFDAYSQVYTHLSTSLVIAGTVGISLIAGISYGLAACFIVHLMARAYWVGLIGLRTVFPEGINWSKTPGIGPLTKSHYRTHLPDLHTVIERTDRVASSLFAVISLLTLGVLWVGTIVLFTIVVAGLIGARFGLTNAAIGIGTLVLVAVFSGVPALLWLLDAQLARRFPTLKDRRFFSGIVKFLARVSGLVYPQRLVLPVQLTLQSNTRPVIFYIILTFSIAAIVVLGNTRYAAWQAFTLSGAFTYLDNNAVSDGFRSTYYEDMQNIEDRLRGWPRIDSFQQKGSFAVLFLPYQPLRDNLILANICGDEEAGQAGTTCLRKLWSVSINEQPVPIEDFEVAERMDFRMRGLIGLVPLAGLQPGMHHISVVWNTSADEDEAPLDDRYTQSKRTYRIPVAFMPDFERALE